MRHHVLGSSRPGRRFDLSDRPLDRVGDAPEFDLVVLNDREAGAGIAIAGKTDAPRVEDRDAVDVQFELHVRMANADDVGVDVLEPLGPGTRVLEQVFVEGIAWRGVDQQEPLAAQREPLRHGQLQEISPLLVAQSLPHRRSGGLGQITVARLAGHRDALGHSVVVVTPDGVSGVGHRPANARHRVRPVIDQVAQAEADVERLGDRLEGGPVRMNIRDDQNPHR